MGKKLNSTMPAVRGVTIALFVIVILLAGLVLPSLFRSNVEAAAVNVALASNGGTASASSTYSSGFLPGGTINGDRKGLNWQTSGGWNDNTSNTWPDWLQVDFSGTKNISEIDLFTLQDNFQSPVDPTDTMTFSTYGITAFDVQYWDGSSWVTVPGGSVTGNNYVWRKFTFSAIATAKIRVLVNNGNQYSRIVEVEAWENASATATPTPTPTPTPTSNLTNFFNQSYTGSRNSYTGTVGFEFVPSQNLTVTALGRSVSGTMNNSHTIRIWKVADQSVVANVTVTSASSRDANGYAYATLGSGVTLTSGTSYRIASNETSGGDAWRDLADISNHGSTASITYGVYGDGGNYPDKNWGSSNQGYVPVTFFTGAAGPTATPTLTPTPTPTPTSGPTSTATPTPSSALNNFFNQGYSGSRNNYSGSVGYKFTATRNITVNALGRSVSMSMTNSHTVTIWKESDQSVVASVTVTSSSPQDGYGYKYQTLGSSVILTAGTAYRIASSETSGGDKWMDLGSISNHNTFADINCGVYNDVGGYPGFTYGTTNQGYVPVTFYTVEVAPTPTPKPPAPTPWPLPKFTGELNPLDSGRVKLGGYLGGWVEGCMNNRVLVQPYDQMTVDFTNRPETSGWACEMWGKWYTSLGLSYSYNLDIEYYNKFVDSVTGVRNTQTADGTITTYQPGSIYTNWDFWGRKYTLLGLMMNYDLMHDANSLNAARGHTDRIVADVGPSPKRDIMTLSPINGTCATTILEPIVLLHRVTNQQSYLDFANYIKDRWAQSGGPDYLNKALNHQHIDGHAYVVMSNFEGVCELYRTTKTTNYLTASKNEYDTIVNDDLTLIGSGSDHEYWCNGRTNQVPGPAMETCCTVTWLKYCYQLLRLTGDPKYADQIEITAYNALKASMSPTYDNFVHYTYMSGTRAFDTGSSSWYYGMDCCKASAPRAIALLPRIAVMSDAAGPVVNLYTNGSTKATTPAGRDVTINQTTDYPRANTVTFQVYPTVAENFTIKLRIPGWSANTSVTVNGTPQSCTSGTYCGITRTWNSGDTIVLTLDMRGRYYDLPGAGTHNAIMVGPIVLSRDARFNDGDVDAVKQIVQSGGYVNVTPITPPDTSLMWMGYTVPTTSGDIKMCDFASAGDTYDAASKFRVWMQK
jgi:uncharacterized protein